MIFSSKIIAASTAENWRKPFFLIWTGQSVSLLGGQLVQFALIWWLTVKTGSATMLAFASFFSYLPEVILAPFAGALVDRWNRRRVMIAADGSIALVTGMVAVLFWLGWVQIWHVFVVLFLRSLGSLFHWTAMKASTSMMVPEEHLARIAGINQAVYGGVNIAGPALGALLLGVMPIFGVLFIDVGTALLAIIPLLFVLIPQPQESKEAVTVRSVLVDVREGLQFVLSWCGLSVLLVMAVMCNFFFTPLFTILPILVTDFFKGGVYQLGWIESAWGVGVVAGGLILGAWGGFKRKITSVLAGLIGMGLGMLLVWLAPADLFVLALVGMAFAGVSHPITNGPFHAIIQSRVAPEMQGRVFTLVASLATAAVPLSMLAAGPAADAFGPRVLYAFGGAGCLLMGVAGFFMPAMQHLED
ncbi:MAG: MFS transporter [Anaerolineaceae bacterium]|jgi:DHA3 family macrolide efflux protein-like MFS transporter|nr:MFS transporter [Anaerolineaceae bacterium]